MSIRFILSLVALFSALSAGAQIKIDYAADTSGVTIHTDPRLDILMASLRPRSAGGAALPGTGSIRSGRGFRVQIYNGNDRVKANEVKVDFIHRYPGVRVYMTYIQPQYRVKVGDFRSRSEAHALYQQLSGLYSPVIIVPDIIVINTFKDDPKTPE